MSILARVRDVTEDQRLAVQPDDPDFDAAAAVERLGSHSPHT